MSDALPTFVPSIYKISTITATASISTCVNLDLLYESITLEDHPNIVYIEYGMKKLTTVHKGKAKNSNKMKSTKKRFDNQVTIAFAMSQHVNINTKIFRNGNIQMTGVRALEQGLKVVDWIIETLKTIHVKNPSVVEDVASLKNTDFKIRLINCDFRAGFEIKRDKLFQVMLTQYNTFSSYEPCIYPGLKVQFWYNTENPHKDGKCYCTNTCTGKGSGVGDGHCKKVTIAVFQSGCIIITGGQSIQQINAAYNFICDVIRNHLSSIYKHMPIFIAEEKRKLNQK